LVNGRTYQVQNGRHAGGSKGGPDYGVERNQEKKREDEKEGGNGCQSSFRLTYLDPSRKRHNPVKKRSENE